MQKVYQNALYCRFINLILLMHLTDKVQLLLSTSNYNVILYKAVYTATKFVMNLNTYYRNYQMYVKYVCN